MNQCLKNELYINAFETSVVKAQDAYPVIQESLTIRTSVVKARNVYLFIQAFETMAVKAQIACRKSFLQLNQ